MLISEEIRSHYDNLASSYETRWLHYIQAQSNWILGHWPSIGSAKEKTVLDIGCGTGMILGKIHERFPTLSLAGVDISTDMLSRGKQRLPHASLTEGNIEDASVAARLPSADIILSLSVLHHLTDVERHLRLLAKLVNPKGTIFLADFSLDGIVMKLGDLCFRFSQSHYLGSLSRRELSGKILQVFRSAETISAVLRPDWFWRIQIYRIDIGSK